MAAPHVLVVAAGRGSRAGAGLPKQFRPLCGQPLITHTLRSLLTASPDILVTPVIHPDDRDLFDGAANALDGELRTRLREPAHGGATRQDSVRRGLDVMDGVKGDRPATVLIHDGARPFPSVALIARAVACAREFGAAVPGFAVTDTIKEIATDGWVVGTPDRSRLRAVQTPQAFDFDLILAAHRLADRDERHDLTDDAAVAEYAGHRVHIFEGEPDNMKITTAADVAKAEARLQAGLLDVRIGQGYDVHSFESGDHVWLGGIRIPHTHKLNGHSDADVVLHALTDAVLGAIGAGAIGVHFPPSQAR